MQGIDLGAYRPSRGEIVGGSGGLFHGGWARKGYCLSSGVDGDEGQGGLCYVSGLACFVPFGFDLYRYSDAGSAHFQGLCVETHDVAKVDRLLELDLVY